MKTFLQKLFARILSGGMLGCLLGIGLHLVLWDTRVMALYQNWTGTQNKFDGVHAYQRELLTLICVLLAAVFFLSFSKVPRYARSWWYGIVSVIPGLTTLITIFLLESRHVSLTKIAVAVAVLFTAVCSEYYAPRRELTIVNPKVLAMLKENAPAEASANLWQSTTDDPIEDWSEDLLGRTSIVERLAEHAVAFRTPVVALSGSLGDGKSSVLNLLRRAIEDVTIVVSFSAWLPGSETTLATDLFRDIANECRKHFYVPQLRKRALAYGRMLSGSVSYLSGLKEMLPAESQKEEIEELKQSFRQVPMRIVVLLDELDRMNSQELEVLFKILRGAATIPHTTFVCAFSDAEIQRRLAANGEVTREYFEKFFQVTVPLPPPDIALVGRLFTAKLKARFTMPPSWFSGQNEEKRFSDLIEQLWANCMSLVCTNLRKSGLLLNDIFTAAELVELEVDALDLVAIECLRRFFPDVYQLVRRNPVFLTYEAGLDKDLYFAKDDKRTADSAKFFQELESKISETQDGEAARGLLSYMFPTYDDERKALLHSHLRHTTRDDAWVEKRICHPDYFPLYFRYAIPEYIFSNAELVQVLADLNKAASESAAATVIDRVLEQNPKQHPRRDDALWKIGRAVDKLSDKAAEQLAFAIASRASAYYYDQLNTGEASYALNIVFEVAQKLADTTAVQGVLEGAMARAADDTFALRLLEYTEFKDRNRILTNFSNIDIPQVKRAFMERMRSRYGSKTPIESVVIEQGDWGAFRAWARQSDADRKIEQDFWARYIGQSRKRLAQAINILYPSGWTWNEDPRPTISELFPVDELARMTQSLPEEQLDEVEQNGIVRLRQLTEGKWFDIHRRMGMGG